MALKDRKKSKKKLKSKDKESVDTAINSISAIRTILEEYPIVITDDSISGDATKSSVSFLLNILKMFGISEDDLLDEICGWLSDKDSFLDKIEYAIKAILLANVKNMFTCSLNPLIPDRLLYPTDIEEKGQSRHIPIYPEGNGIAIKISDIDLFDTLQLCPVSDKGKNYYFDAYTPIYNRYRDGELKTLAPYSANHLWASCDFDAYLWYIIHRSSGNKLKRPYFWDNRCKFIEKLAKDDELRAEFFNDDEKQLETRFKNKYYDITSKSNKIRQYGMLIGQFEETPGDKDEWKPTNGAAFVKNLNTNVVRFFINPWRYGRRCLRIPLDIRKKDKKTGEKKPHEQYVTLWMNSTVFEFNFEYIWYTKLFDTKTIVSRIIYALFQTIKATEFTFSVEEELIKGEVRNLVEEVITMEDTEIDDCFLRFSNRDYDVMLEEAKERYNGKIKIADDEDAAIEPGVTMEELSSMIESIDAATTPDEQKTIIKNVFTKFAYTGGTEDSAKDNFSFSMSNTIIEKLLNELSVQLVLSILSPKIAVLFKINSEVMGDISEWDENDKMKFDGWGDFIKNFKNMLFQVILEIKEIIVQMLLSYVMRQITPLLQLYAMKLIKEAINDYRKLINTILENCTFDFGMIGRLLRNKYSNVTIDNVMYADIVPTATPPNNDECNPTKEP